MTGSPFHFFRRVPSPVWIALASGIGAWALRTAANGPRPLYVGVGVGAIVFAVTWAVRTIDAVFSR